MRMTGWLVEVLWSRSLIDTRVCIVVVGWKVKFSLLPFFFPPRFQVEGRQRGLAIGDDGSAGSRKSGLGRVFGGCATLTLDCVPRECSV